MKTTALTTLVLALLLSACSGTNQPPGGNTNIAIISLSPATATIQVGQTQTFTATAKDSSGTPLNATFDWASSNPQTATVSSGKATGVALGTTNITASAGGVTSNAAALIVDATGGGAQPLHDTIAYASGNGDEIRLVNPDGTNDRRLWAHGQADPEGVYQVWSTSWSPDATELAFASTHENGCSLYHADLFAVEADGTDYRRVSQAPACAELANYPKGTVNIPVRNSSFESFSGFLYFQGAPSIQPVNLPPSGTGMVTFENVADFGDGDDGLQIAMVIYGNQRELAFSTVVDVIAGGTVTTGATEVYVPSSSWEVRSPTWSLDGSRLGHLLNFDGLWQLPSEPTPLEFGSPLLADDSVRPGGFAGLLAWGPTAATANQLLYSMSFGETGVYLVREGSADAGELLTSVASYEAVFGLAWLPDGSGFVYSVTEGDFFGEDRSANLFHYDFASKQTTRITNLVGDFAGQVGVSGDGQRLVFERAAELDDVGGSLVSPDLWTVNRDGSGLTLFVENAYAPAWSW